MEEAWDMNSDHSPILLTLSNSIIQNEITPRMVNKFTDWKSFENYNFIHINLSVPLRSQELDNETGSFVKVV